MLEHPSSHVPPLLRPLTLHWLCMLMEQLRGSGVLLTERRQNWIAVVLESLRGLLCPIVQRATLVTFSEAFQAEGHYSLHV